MASDGGGGAAGGAACRAADGKASGAAGVACGVARGVACGVAGGELADCDLSAPLSRRDAEIMDAPASSRSSMLQFQYAAARGVR